jgi:hypothetical protein
VRSVTNEQQRRRNLFKPTVWAVDFLRYSLLTSRASFALAARTQISRSAKLARDPRRCRQSGSDRLEKQPTDLRRKTRYFGDRTLVPVVIVLFAFFQVRRAGQVPSYCSYVRMRCAPISANLSGAALTNALRCRRTVSVCAVLRRAKRGRFAYFALKLGLIRCAP